MKLSVTCSEHDVAGKRPRSPVYRTYDYLHSRKSAMTATSKIMRNAFWALVMCSPLSATVAAGQEIRSTTTPPAGYIP